MKLARTIQLDVSDNHVFERPAAVGEWAITGTFVFAFADDDPADWSGKRQLAFRTAWLGLGSFGHSTFVQVVEMAAQEYEQAVETLAQYLGEKYGAPSPEAAAQAARQEIDDMAALCDHPPGTLLAIERAMTDQNITEKTRLIAPFNDTPHTRVWSFTEEE